MIVLKQMRDMTKTVKTYGASFARFIHSHLTPKKKLVCDICNRKDGAKSEWEGTIEVWNWGNEHDCGTICDECQEDMVDNQ